MRGRGARFLGLAGSSILIVLVAMPAFGASSNSTAGPGVGAVRWIEGNATWPAQGLARAMVLMQTSSRLAVSGYTLDGRGGIHPFGGAPAVFGATSFADDVARGIVLSDVHGGLFVEGYTLDFSGA